MEAEGPGEANQLPDTNPWSSILLLSELEANNQMHLSPVPGERSSNQLRWPGPHPSVSPEEGLRSGLSHPCFFHVKDLVHQNRPLPAST